MHTIKNPAKLFTPVRTTPYIPETDFIATSPTLKLPPKDIRVCNSF